MGCGGYHLVVGDVAQVLVDVPAVAERVVELAVQVAPEGVLQRLANLGAGGNRLSEHRLRIGDVERQYDGSPTDRGRRENAHLRKLVGQVEKAVADAQLNRHEPAVRGRDALDLLGAERFPVEGRGALGALNDNVCGDRHACTVRRREETVLNVLAPA